MHKRRLRTAGRTEGFFSALQPHDELRVVVVLAEAGTIDKADDLNDKVNECNHDTYTYEAEEGIPKPGELVCTHVDTMDTEGSEEPGKKDCNDVVVACCYISCAERSGGAAKIEGVNLSSPSLACQSNSRK